MAEYRNATIRIAACSGDESGALQELNSQSLASLVNGFSKWPEEAASRQATIAIAGDVLRPGDRLSHFDQQDWPAAYGSPSALFISADAQSATMTAVLNMRTPSGRNLTRRPRPMTSSSDPTCRARSERV